VSSPSNSRRPLLPSPSPVKEAAAEAAAAAASFHKTMNLANLLGGEGREFKHKSCSENKNITNDTRDF